MDEGVLSTETEIRETCVPIKTESPEGIANERFSGERFRVAARVMFAQDDEEIRRRLRDEFVLNGYEVFDTGDGLELIDRYEQRLLQRHRSGLPR